VFVFIKTLRLCEKNQDLCSRGERRARCNCFRLLTINKKNILCELCALARDPVDSVNLATIVLQFGSALTSCVSSSHDYCI
jgi:hypothetical protein